MGQVFVRASDQALHEFPAVALLDAPTVMDLVPPQMANTPMAWHLRGGETVDHEGGDVISHPVFGEPETALTGNYGASDPIKLVAIGPYVLERFCVHQRADLRSGGPRLDITAETRQVRANSAF
jgi:hypothetical protein